MPLRSQAYCGLGRRSRNSTGFGAMAKVIALGVNIGFLAVGAVINNAAVNICTLFFWWTNAYISVGMYLEELENSWVWTRVLVDTA